MLEEDCEIIHQPYNNLYEIVALIKEAIVFLFTDGRR